MVKFDAALAVLIIGPISAGIADGLTGQAGVTDGDALEIRRRCSGFAFQSG